MTKELDINKLLSMNEFLQHKQIFSFITIVLFVASCNGQDIKNTPSETTIIKTATPKLIKTQGSTKGDNVWCALQDKTGCLWFGTTGEGVYRYNGNSFTQFTVKDGLNSNAVYSILEDKTGNIWIGTTDGICCYDGKKFSRLSIPKNYFSTNNDNSYYNNQSTPNTVWSILQDKKGILWFGTGDGVYCYNGKKATRFLQNDGVINKGKLHLRMIDCMLQDKNGNIWFASGCPPGEEGVCRYDGTSIVSFKPNGDGWVRYIKEDMKGNLWFGGRLHGNFVYDGKNFKNFTEKVGIGNPLLADRKGNIWFSGEEKESSVESKDGIWCYDGNTFKNYYLKNGMDKYFVWNMFEDRDGNIWIGTRNTGLFKYDGKTFTNLSE